MQKQLNHSHFGHAIMPQATHDEQAMEDHFLAMRAWTNRNVDPLDRRLLDEVIVPEVEAATSKKPTSSAHVRKPIPCTNIGSHCRCIIRIASGVRSTVPSRVNMTNWQRR